MPKYTKLPAISGNRLIRLLQKDGWEVRRQATHGVSLAKKISDRTKVTVVPATDASLDGGTLAAILGQKQTGIGKRGLLDLLNKYGM